MIKNIILDFGDIFINLDKPATIRELQKYGLKEPTLELELLAIEYETGLISTKDFISKANHFIPQATQGQLIDAWNAIILDFPEYRLEFIEALAKEKEYRLFLLSNTNTLHIEKVLKNLGMEGFERFKNCFEQFYLSHKIHLRKPNHDIFTFVLDKNTLKEEETLFIDDMKPNTDAAEQVGLKTWNLQVGLEDIIHLKSKL